MLRLSDRISSVLNRKGRQIWSVTTKQTVCDTQPEASSVVADLR